jgi:type I restriction enzyme S subunit
MVAQARNLPALFESNMMRFRLRDDADPGYVDIFLRSSIGRERLTAGAKWAVNQASINQRDVAATVIDLPARTLQVRIVVEAERQLSLADAVENELAQALLHCGRLRQAILRRAFSGQLVPQDPNDEPASVLLERIRAGRARQAAQNGKGRGRRPRG